MVNGLVLKSENDAQIPDGIAELQNVPVRRDILALMSHELRTPLNSIIGFGEILSSVEEVSTVERKEFAQIIRTSGNVLLSSVNTLLFLARIQSGQFTLAPETINAAALMSSCWDYVKTEGDWPDAELVHSEGLSSTIDFVADKFAIKKVLVCLIKIFMRQTGPEAGVEVEVQNSRENVVFRVSAYPSDETTAADNPGENTYYRDGNGLDHALIEAIVSLHNGQFLIEDSLTAGFWASVTLPVKFRRSN